MRLLIVLILLCALPVHGQSFVTGVERELSLSMNPEHPSAGERVRFSLEGYAVDVDRSMIVWYVNGKEVARGAGLKDFERDAPRLGSEETIRAVAEEVSGIIGVGTALLRPGEVTLLWEAQSYTHPFYRGRALPGSQSTIRAHAFTDLRRGTARIAENDIIFSWYRDGARFSSGRGLSSVSFQGPTLFDSDRIGVVAESLDGTISARSETSLRGEDAKLELYEHHPLFGTLYHRAFVGTVLNLEEEQKVATVPFFAPVTPRDPSLVYEWAAGGVTTSPDPQTPEILTLRREGEFNGVITLALTLSSLSDIFLKATNTWSIQYAPETNFSNPFLSL